MCREWRRKEEGKEEVKEGECERTFSKNSRVQTHYGCGDLRRFRSLLLFSEP